MEESCLLYLIRKYFLESPPPSPPPAPIAPRLPEAVPASPPAAPAAVLPDRQFPQPDDNSSDSEEEPAGSENL